MWTIPRSPHCACINLWSQVREHNKVIVVSLIDSQTWRTNSSSQRGRMGGKEREFGMDMYTLLYLKWITNKDLPYSTWNSAQCFVDRRGVWGRMDTCTHMAESLRCSPETITTLWITYTPIENNNNKPRTVLSSKGLSPFPILGSFSPDQISKPGRMIERK